VLLYLTGEEVRKRITDAPRAGERVGLVLPWAGTVQLQFVWPGEPAFWRFDVDEHTGGAGLYLSAQVRE
jgi:hypothetical protein